MSSHLVTCICDEVTLRDLGIRLTRGAEVPLSAQAVETSADLRAAKAEGKVTVRDSRPRTPAPPVEAASTGPLLALGQQLLGGLAELTGEVRALREQLAASPAPGPELVEQLRSLLEGTPLQAPHQATAVPESPAEETPRFIPTLDGSGFGSRSIQVTSSTSTDAAGTLDATTAALRAARKPRG